jgi:formylglycine-generating enzyme
MGFLAELDTFWVNGLLMPVSLLPALLLLSSLGHAEDYPLWPPIGDLSTVSPLGAEDAAVIITIEDYLFLPDFPGAKASGQVWKDWLIRGRGLSEDKIIWLQDGEATAKNIDKKLKKAAKKISKNGTLWVVYAGHAGGFKGKPMLLPADLPSSKRGMKANRYQWNRLQKWLGKGKQVQSIVLTESCWNGKTPDGTSLGLPIEPPPASSLRTDDSTVFLSQGLSSCHGDLPHLSLPSFSYLAVGALHGWADNDTDGSINAKEMVSYVNKVVSEASPGRTQNSQMLGDDPDLLLGQGREEGPDLEEISLYLYPRAKEKRGPSGLPWDIVEGIADFDDLMSSLREKRELSITFESEKREKETAVKERAERHWAQVEGFAGQQVDDFSRMAAYAFLQKYKDATVEVQEKQVPVDIPQLKEAETLILGMELPELDSFGFAYVPMGSFVMGSPLEEADRDPEERQHIVNVNYPFYMSKTEISQELYESVMGVNPSSTIGPDLPVGRVSWFDAVSFANRLSLKEGLEPCYNIQGESVSWPKGFRCEGYRLPTEAEWEYSARANGAGSYAGSDNLSSVAWYEANSKGQVRPVAQLNPNAFGLFDMSGNVWEWVWDGYAPYPTGEAVDDPKGDNDSSYRIRRGGSVGHLARYSRAAYRVRVDPNFRSYDIGFRLVRTAAMPDP